MDKQSPSPAWTRRILIAGFIGGLLFLSYLVLQDFLIPVTWAVILAYATWPLYVRLRRALGGRNGLGALAMTLILVAALVLPLLWLIGMLQGEVAGAYQTVMAYAAQSDHRLPEGVARVPWIGGWLQGWVDRVVADPATFKATLAHWGERWSGSLARVVGGVGRNTVKFGLALFTVFFFYRDGESFLLQSRRVLERALGERSNAYLSAAAVTVKAVVYGLVLTALAQGLLAGLGYWVAGVEAPVLFGAVTALAALIPFGTPFVWGSLGIWLVFSGQTWAGIGLLLWGGLVVSWVDNLIRPLVISGATRIPFLLVMFGVLGGLTAFGLVGLFLGPVILAVLMAVWREWLEERESTSPIPPAR